ncbi:MAG: SH3 domain-containing protein [Anaerolineales bacterium]
MFVLHSASAFEPPRPAYDAAAESAVFAQIMQSFGWLATAPNTSTTASTIPTATTTATFTASPVPNSASAFAQSIVDLLNARNFDAVKTKMGQTFATGFWESQGTSSTPDQAIDAFRNLYVGSTPLTSDANKDLNSLLGGLNPYGIMGLDPANSYGLFVSGLGPEGKSEAIFYVVKKADGSFYFFGMLFAPTKFIHDAATATPSPSPTTAPVTLSGPYAVVRVAPDDTLNIRSAAGSTNPVVGSFAAEATNVMKTGPTQTAEGAKWVQVQNPSGGVGWVNSSYLTEQVTHDTFCGDSRIVPLLDQFKQALNSSDGNLLSTLVSPTHGVNFRLWKYSAGVDFTTTTVKDIFTSTTSYDWGGGPSGIPDVGTFSNEVKPNYLDALNAPNRELYCDNLTKVFPLSDPWPNHTIRYYNIYKPATPNIFFDFRSLLIGVEFVNNQPYLYSVITIVWEP